MSLFRVAASAMSLKLKLAAWSIRCPRGPKQLLSLLKLPIHVVKLIFARPHSFFYFLIFVLGLIEDNRQLSVFKCAAACRPARRTLPSIYVDWLNMVGWVCVASTRTYRFIRLRLFMDAAMMYYFLCTWASMNCMMIFFRAWCDTTQMFTWSHIFLPLF